MERLGSFFDAWFSLGTLTASAMGRTAGKIEDLERVLQMLGNFRGNTSDCGELGRLRGAKVGAFKEVESKRLKFRGFPVFDPCPFLDENSRAIYLHPLQHSTPPESFEGRVPRVRVHCSREERLLLYQLLDRSNRIKLFSKDQVRVGFGSGVFAVLKSLEADRLILDSRPHNLLEAPPGRFIRTLGSADPILQLHLTQDENIYISSNDIRDFYHLFRVSDERCRRNSLVATVRPHEVSGFKSFQKWMYGHSELYVGLACLAMGDTQAVELAQSCHLGICLQHDIIQADNLVAMNLPPPRRRTMAGIVIDDFVSLSIESRKPEEIAACPSEACRLADKAFGIYKKVKLIPHEEKSVRDELRADFWGLSLDGELGLARGSLKRAAPLMKVIVTVLQVGCCTIGLLEVLAGGLIALFIYRRRLLCLLEEIFVAMKGKDQDCVIKIEAALYQELLICASLLPLAVVELRADYNPDVFAVDASDWGEAVTSCPTTSAFTKELSRHALRKGVWTRLLAPAAARARSHGNLDPDRELPGGEEARFRSHPLWTTVFRVGKFGVAWKRGTPRRRHINIGELRAFLHAEKAGKLRGKASRVLIGGDSQVALGCMLKGRSASRSLNLELQKSLGFILGGGVQSYLMYCPTKLNPADDPTRGAAVREPSLPEPSWWASALLGDFALLDQWLALEKSDPLSLSGIPDLEELSRAWPREMENHIAKAHLKSCKRLRDVLNGARNLTDHPDFPSSTATVRDWPKEAIEASKLTGSVIFPKGASRSECSARSGYIDLFSGSGGVCRELCRLTGRWVVSYDIIHSSSEDLLKPVVQDEVLSLIDSGAILGVGAAPVCSSMSRAITPSWRSAAEPYGIVGLTQAQQKKVSEGNEFAKFVAKVCAACLRRSIPFWVENPVASFLWWIPEVVSISRSPGVGFWTVDFCAFGTPWRKRTRFLTTTCLAGQKTLCPGCLAHQILRGRSKQHKKSWTRVAEPYPKGLSLVVAMALSGASGDRPEFNKLDAWRPSFGKASATGCSKTALPRL